MFIIIIIYIYSEAAICLHTHMYIFQKSNKAVLWSLTKLHVLDSVYMPKFIVFAIISSWTGIPNVWALLASHYIVQ